MKDDNWVVSPVTADDLPVIFTIDSQAPSPWTQSQLEGELYGPHGQHLAARHPSSNRLVGFILARTIGDEAEILKIATSQDAQRQGAASCLINEFTRLISSKGVLKCHLELRFTNNAARCLYEKFGFQVTGLRKNYYNDPKDDALCMSLSLA